MAIIGNVSPTDLITSAWGNTVGNELDERCVKVNGTIGDGVTPNQWMTGSLIIQAAPALKLRRTGNQPYLQFESTTGTRYGYLMGEAPQMTYLIDAPAGIHRFIIDASERFRVNSTGVDVSGALTTTGLTSDARVTVGGNGELVRLVDTSTSGSDFHDCFVGYYGGGVSLVSPGTRTGFVGYNSTTTLQLHNEITGGAVSLITTGAGGIVCSTGGGPVSFNAGGSGDIQFTAGGQIFFTQGGAERGRIVGSLMWGKTAGGIATPGVELFEDGTIYSTKAAATVNMIARHNANTDGAPFIQFQNASGGVLSQIEHDNVAPVGTRITACAVSAPSDYRMKNDLGPVVDALGRLMQLQPKHLSWKETGQEFDGFLAHEVQAVVPTAVYGAKDAVYDADEAELMGVEPGTIKPQQLDQIPLIPLLTAALHELADRVTALEDI
jgi:hypothetical protein